MIDRFLRLFRQNTLLNRLTEKTENTGCFQMWYKLTWGNKKIRTCCADWWGMPDSILMTAAMRMQRAANDMVSWGKSRRESA